MNPIPEDKNTQYGYWMPTVIFEKKSDFNRDKLLKIFKEKNIDGRVFFYPLSSLPMFDEKKENQISYNIFERGINLPSYHDMKIDNIKTIFKLIIS